MEQDKKQDPKIGEDVWEKKKKNVVKVWKSAPFLLHQPLSEAVISGRLKTSINFNIHLHLKMILMMPKIQNILLFGHSPHLTLSAWEPEWHLKNCQWHRKSHQKQKSCFIWFLISRNTRNSHSHLENVYSLQEFIWNPKSFPVYQFCFPSSCSLFKKQ